MAKRRRQDSRLASVWGFSVARAAVEPSLRAIFDQVKDKGPGGHILTGPVFVEGAEPGDTLEIRIRKRGEDAIVWSGTALTVRAAGTPKGADAVVAADLTRALLAPYPAQSPDVVAVP